ncbi:MAG: GspH/FimT family pseudopilin [Thermodesulfobacteriota bacterium]|nr:GspH/FimT family pseudopilin [Thermodesulfobacteriota bacterium]
MKGVRGLSIIGIKNVGFKIKDFYLYGLRIMSKDFLKIESRFQGVTLLELMVVIVIMAVMASIALPGMSRWIFRNRLENQAETMAALLDQVRLEAMKNMCPYRVVFLPGQGKYFAFCDKDEDGVWDTGEDKQGPFSLDDGVRFGSLAGHGPNNTTIASDGITIVGNRINFSKMGSSNAGTIYLASEDTSYALRVLPASGAVRIWRYRGRWEKCR